MASFQQYPDMKNRIMGVEHASIFDLFSRMVRSNESGDHAALREVLELMENGLCAYFADRNNSVRTLGSGFHKPDPAHPVLLDKILKIKDGLLAENGISSKHNAKACIDSLWYCLLQLIEEDERLLKFMLEADFRKLEPIRMESAPLLYCSG